MNTSPILQYLKKHGQKLDLELAAAPGIPLPHVRNSLSELSERGEYPRSVTRFRRKTGSGTLCRISIDPGRSRPEARKAGNRR
jgi:hypothetical protein